MSAERTVVGTGWRLRDREWAWLALALIAVTALFSVYPALDLRVSGWFHEDRSGFFANGWGWLRVVYEAVPWIGRGLALLALLLWLGARAGLRLPRPWQRRVGVLGLALLLGVGLVVNGVLKESWGRARPVAVTQFGGTAHFSPALRPVQECRTNCAFVSGHAATGFVLAAVGLLGAPRTRRRWLLIGTVAGLAIGLMRIAQGAHFASDVLFCGVVIWGCNLLMREAALRWALRQRRRATARRATVAAAATPMR